MFETCCVNLKQTYDLLKCWLDLELKKNKLAPHYRVLVFANKIDLEAQRQVMEEEGREFAESKGFLFMEGSAKTGQNTNEAIFSVLEHGMTGGGASPTIKYV